MRNIERTEASQFLRAALLEAMHSPCSTVKEGIVIVNDNREIIKTGYKRFASQRGILCRGGGECHKRDMWTSCPAEHTLRATLTSTFHDGHCLNEATLYMVSIVGKRFYIANNIACCNICEAIVIHSGIKVALWSHGEKVVGCVEHDTADLKRLKIMHIVQTNANVGFPLETWESQFAVNA